MSASLRAQKGFTLIELLIVIGIIGFLAAAVLVAVDPVKRIQDSRDARRFSEANALLNAILTKQVDDRALYNGDPATPILPGTSSTLAQVIVRSPGSTNCSAGPSTRPGCNVPLDTFGTVTCIADLEETASATSLVPNFIAVLPVDPRNAGLAPCNDADNLCTAGTEGDTILGDNNTGYYIRRTNGNRIEIGACLGEQLNGSGAISVKR